MMTGGVRHRLSKALSGFEGLLEGLTKEEVGVDDGEGTPVPIPNTAVKLTGADNTWLEAARDDKKMPTQGNAPHGSAGHFSVFVFFLCKRSTRLR